MTRTFAATRQSARFCDAINYRKVLDQLRKFVDKHDLSELEKQGLVKAFEYTCELAWNTMKGFLTYKGQQGEMYGSRDAIRQAFATGLVADGDGLWTCCKAGIKRRIPATKRPRRR